MGVMDIKFVVEIMVEYEVFGERLCREKERPTGRTLGTPAFTGSAKKKTILFIFNLHNLLTYKRFLGKECPQPLRK